MYKIAKFEKVSFEQFKKDWLKSNPTTKTKWTDEELIELYNNITLPKRSSVGSAGYDFFAPTDLIIHSPHAVVIPTGIRCKIEDGWFLDLNPRSGHGFKFGIHLANTRGIIDSDYYNADNEGHIMVKLINDCHTLTESPVVIEKNNAFCQGIFTIYGITEDDEVTAIRTGGLGSSDKKVR